MSFVWLKEETMLAVHSRLLAVHGGTSGIRDRGLLDSALARPQNLAAYSSPDVFQLAAAYASGIVANHPFVDGNKRTGFMAAFIFLARHGQDLRAPEPEATRMMWGLAAGEFDENEIASWLRENCRPSGP